jgi:hypothetical protein
MTIDKNYLEVFIDAVAILCQSKERLKEMNCFQVVDNLPPANVRVLRDIFDIMKKGL